ncbi:Serine protease, subtilisin family [Prevotella communis]|uniref:Serine protease, subtilisin family n=2 Tax=Prevotella communis TaxID=2913614 RepID=A0A1H0DGL5_9BACT|nr:Serine protease, subtilisin family [Prevotella communis]SDN69295.1 Serine protease, subtilisin family [Prevotella communis]
MPLSLNEEKVVVSIPKSKAEICERIRANAKVLEKINDDIFDIFVISRSDFNNLTSLDSWSEDEKSMMITSSYFTERKAEVFASPYLNIQLKNEEDVNLLISYAEMYKLQIVRNMPLMPDWYILSVTPESEKSPLQCANELSESGMFSASVPDLCSEVIACSNDPLFNAQWGLENQNTGYSNIDISASSAWVHATGKFVKIAIFDGGVDTTHIDLVHNLSYLRYDAETGTSPSRYYQYKDHATHCAGIAAAEKDNEIQIAGVAPDATIVPISINFSNTSNFHLKAADGIMWACQHGVDIISNSWHRETKNPALDIAIDYAIKYGRQDKGCIMVFASGNYVDDWSLDTDVSYPANCNDTILVVGAIDNHGARWVNSKYGPELDLVAPGVEIISTLPNDSSGMKTGTSMACPHVAGVAALILELNPELTVSEVNSIICSQAKKIPGVSFNVTKTDGTWNNEYGYGLVDAYSSVQATPKIEYIQNDTITDERYIEAEKIYVGRNVTDRKEYGNVVLGPSNDIWLNANRVIIRNSTKIPVGTNLYIGH